MRSRSQFCRSLAIILAALIFPPATIVRNCMGCLWDYDTLAMERQRFPNAHELIVGHFIRHSSNYYRWRIQDRQSKPDSELTPEDFDDIAVAHEKLGAHEEAIQTIKEKIRRWPDRGTYESAANLGTFYIHSGRLEEGVEQIDRALEINPDAHFGREVYQKLVVKYVLERRAEKTELPLNEEFPGFHGFAAFLIKTKSVQENQIHKEILAATKGVLGMMRFGQFESPILLEYLGDLMMTETGDGDAKMLASRAYLKASYHVEDSRSKAAYRAKASEAISLVHGLELPGLDKELKSEISQAQQFFEQIEADEKQWANGGEDLDRLFAKKHYSSPQLKIADVNRRPGDPLTSFMKRLVLILVVAWIASFTYRRLKVRRGLQIR